MKKIALLFFLSVATLLFLSYETDVFLRKFSYEEDISCRPQPKMSVEDVIEAADQAGLRRLSNGFWRIHYDEASSWNKHPFQDHCIWVVRLYKNINTEDAQFAGMGAVYISDETKETYRYP